MMVVRRKADRIRALSSRLESFCSFYDVREPEAAMRIACRELLADCKIDSAPVPLLPLCDHVGVKVVRRQTLGRGTLRGNRGGVEVWVSSEQRKWRRERFTIAHEIAHLLILRASNNNSTGDSITREASDDYAEVERLCNLGAAEILMPEQLALRRFGEWGFSAAALQQLYDAFLVSFETLLYRLAETIPSSAMILWRRYARHGSEATALRVLTSYQRYRDSANAPWLPKGCTAKHVFPDIVSSAHELQKPVFARELVLSLNKHEVKCRGIATAIPKPRTDESQMPLFEGMRVRDEAAFGMHVALLVGKSSMEAKLPLWKKLEEKTCAEGVHFWSLDGSIGPKTGSRSI